MIRNVLNIRFGTLWTAARAHRQGTPYRTAAGPVTDGLCPHCHAGPDTAGHILGACTHPAITRCRIARHNAAVCRIHDAIASGSKGGCFCVMDATARDDAPDTVYSTRLPAWLLPDVPASTRAKMRPDILLIDGLPLASVRALGEMKRMSPPALAALQSRGTVHVIEVGYCAESSTFQAARERKCTQHVALCRALLAAGWTLAAPLPVSPDAPPAQAAAHAPPRRTPCRSEPPDPDYTLIMLGMAGTIFTPFDRALVRLGVSASVVSELARDLHVHAVVAASRIVCLRRALDFPKPAAAGSGQQLSPPDPP